MKEEEQNTIKGYLGDDKKKKAEKRKAETSSGEAKENKKAKVDSKEDREKLKNQSKVLWETLEKLRDLHRDVVTELLEKNNSVYGKGGVEAVSIFFLIHLIMYIILFRTLNNLLTAWFLELLSIVTNVEVT